MAKVSDEIAFWAFGIFAMFCTVFLLFGLAKYPESNDALMYIFVILPVAIGSWIVAGVSAYQCMES